MEEVIDRLIEECKTLATTSGSTGLADFLSIKDVKFDDPGIVLVDEYPYIYVGPVTDEPASETVGRAGYDIRHYYINVCLVINQSDYFDETVSELAGSRELVRAGTRIRRWLRRLDKRTLDGLVRNLVVQSTNYVPDVRASAFVRMAVTTLDIEIQDQHEE